MIDFTSSFQYTCDIAVRVVLLCSQTSELYLKMSGTYNSLFGFIIGMDMYSQHLLLLLDRIGNYMWFFFLDKADKKVDIVKDPGEVKTETVNGMLGMCKSLLSFIFI